MHRDDAHTKVWLLLLGSLVLSLIAGCSPGPEAEPPPGLRGVWAHPGRIDTVEKADATLDRLEAGGFDTILALVWQDGHAYFESELLPKHPRVATDYDPLSYLVAAAHERGIAVHAWLVVGRQCHRGEMGPILQEHPEWAMEGPDGRRTCWLNFNRPDVRAFVGDVVTELVSDYGVDGVHFDYTRYPGPEWGYDDYSAELLAEEQGLDLNRLRYAELPAFGRFRANPLLWPGDAVVLAEFDDRQPAVLLNDYGEGTAIVLNWDASRRLVAASSEILDRSIEFLLGEGGQVYVVHSQTTIDEYGPEALEEVTDWLEDLGWQPTEIPELELSLLDPQDVLVLPKVYTIEALVARELADFVERGGGAVFIDGPTPSILNRDVRAITGMNFRGKASWQERLMVPTQEHEIIPTSDRSRSLAEYEALDEEWKQFRREGINRLLAEVHGRIKQEAPDALLSVTVAAGQEALANSVLQDWQAWLEDGTIDLLVLRAYVSKGESLDLSRAGWGEVLESSDRIAVGLSVSYGAGDETEPKPPERVLDEIDVAVREGSQGIVLFRLEKASDDLLEALSKGPFSSPEADSD